MQYNGDVHHYEHVLASLKERDEPETLFRLYIGLCSCTSILTHRLENYRELIKAIFSYQWDMDAKISIAYTNLLGHLVSYNTVFLIPSLEMLVKAFFQTDHDQAFKQVGQLTDKYDRVHRTLQGLMALVPTGQAELFSVIADNFPHARWTVDVHTHYLSQLLRVCEYLPVMQPRILDLVVRKCLILDTEIVIEEGAGGEDGQVTLGESDEPVGTLDDGAEEREDVFYFEEEEAAASADTHGGRMTAPTVVAAVSSSAALATGSHYIGGEMRISADTHVAELADKLDHMLFQLMKFIDARLSRGGDDMSYIIFQLIAVFEDRILPSHKSKFVQFCLFYASQQVGNFARLLCDRCMQTFRDTNSPHRTRQNSVMYLASLCTRAKFLDLSTCVAILDELLAWSHDYLGLNGGANASSKVANASRGVSNSMDAHTDDSGDGDDDGVPGGHALSGLSDHKDFTDADITFMYCVQAMCYIMCFLGMPVASHYASNDKMRALWRSIFDSPLAPLASCVPPVRSEFARLAEVADLVSMEALRVAFAASPSAPKEGSGDTLHRRPQLEAFFPFDPCLLQMCNSIVASEYRPWRGIPGLDFEAQGTFTASGARPSGDVSWRGDGESVDIDGEDDDASTASGGHSLSSSMASSSVGMGNSFNNSQHSQSHMHAHMYAHAHAHTPNLNPNAAAFTPGTHGVPWSAGHSVESGSDMGSGSMGDSQGQGSSYQSSDAQGVWPMPTRRPRNSSITSTGSW